MHIIFFSKKKNKTFVFTAHTPSNTWCSATKPADAKAAPKNSANQTVRQAPPRDSNQNLQERDKESRPPRDKRDHRQAPAGDKKRTFDRKSGTGRP